MENNFYKNYIIKEYLTAGFARDNFVVEMCDKRLLDFVKQHIVTNEDVKTCVINLSHENETNLEKTLNACENDFQKKLLARDYFETLFMQELLKFCTDFEVENNLESVTKALLSGDFNIARKEHINSPTPFDIQQIIKKIGKVELYVFLDNIQNKHLQQAVNNHITSRTNYTIKVFSTHRFSTYYDQAGNLIQSPHDYIIPNFINFNTEEDQR